MPILTDNAFRDREKEKQELYYVSGTMTPTILQDMKSVDTISDAMSLDD